MIHNKFRYLLTLVALFAMATGAWAADTYTITFSGFGNENCNKTITDATLEYSETFNVTDVYVNYIMLGGVGGSNEYVSISKSQDETQITITVKSPFEGTVNVTVYYMNENWDESQSDISVTCVKSAPAIEVTTNAASEGATFTEAWFNMPAFDATAEYELVRDMTQSMTTQVGDGAEGYRIRVKKNEQGEGYVPVEMTPQAMASLIVVHDDIENADLTNMTDYTISIFAVDEQGQPTGEAIAFASLVPGRYVAIATAAEGTIYDGQTLASNIFVLFEGYEIEVAANSFVTYYKDEAVTLDESSADAALYTISSVGETEAVLSEEIDVAPANTPLLIYNSSDEKKTVLLIPLASDPEVTLTVAEEFQGTLVDKTFSEEDMAVADFYVLSDAQSFVWVKDAGTIAANKCWLAIPMRVASANVRSISIVFDEGVTGIGGVESGKLKAESWYDLQGRKVKNPTKKGVYIKGGKKVFVQ